MIVVDTSVFIDLIFEYNQARTHSAEEMFSTIEEKGLTIQEAFISSDEECSVLNRS